MEPKDSQFEKLPDTLRGFNDRKVPNNVMDLATLGTHTKEKISSGVTKVTPKTNSPLGRPISSEEHRKLSSDVTEARKSGLLARHNSRIAKKEGALETSKKPVIKIDSSKG